MAKKPPAKPRKLSQMSPADRAKRVAALVKNPGTRSSVPTQYLPPALRQKRELNARLAQPVVPGSTMTQRDLARAANASTTVKYAPAEQALGQELGHAQGVARDTTGWYDNYLAERAKHAQNVAGFSTDANTAMANLQAGTKGLDQANLDANKAQATANAASRGAAPADLGVAASNGAAVRQAILAAVGGQVADAGRGANTYADTLAHVVAPTEKLSAQTQAAGKVGAVREKQTALKTEEGAYNTSFRQQSVADELKNVLASQVAGVGAAKAGADIAATTTKTQKTAADIAYFKKHGYYPRTGPAPKPAAKTGYQAGGPGLNKYGYTYDQWTAMSPKAQANARAGKDKPKKPTDPATAYSKDFFAKYGVKPASTEAVGNAKNAISTAQSYVNELKASGNDQRTTGQLLLQGQTVETDLGGGKKGKKTYPKLQPLWLRVALDLAWLKGRISAGTADRLHHAGYSVKLLGLNTGSPAVSGPKDLPSGGTGSGGSAPPK